MASIFAVRNSGVPYSHAEGGLKPVLKMVAEMPECRTRQIVISLANLEEYARENRLLHQLITQDKLVYDASIKQFRKGNFKRVMGDSFEIYYCCFFKSNYGIVTSIKVDARPVYMIPANPEGLMKLLF